MIQKLNTFYIEKNLAGQGEKKKQWQPKKKKKENYPAKNSQVRELVQSGRLSKREEGVREHPLSAWAWRLLSSLLLVEEEGIA